MTTQPRRMRQEAPFPTELDDLVGRARCWRGWSFYLEDGEYDDGQVSGLRLFIVVRGANAYHQELGRGTAFLFPVPAVTFNRGAWQRWLWDRAMDVHHHETGEAFGFAYQRTNTEGQEVEVLERPFAPFHGPGRDPTRNVEVGVDPMETRIKQNGGRYPGWWWDGERVHSDEHHDTRCHGRDCTPVQLVEPA